VKGRLTELQENK